MLNERIRILIVEDDPDMAELIADLVEAEGWMPLTAPSAEEAMGVLARETVHLALVDHNLPGTSGRTFAQRLRAQTNIGIVMVTAAGSAADRVLGLETAADDYVVKPFEPIELTARIKAVLRRAMPQEAKRPSSAAYGFADFTADPEQRSVIRAGGEKIELTGAEFDLLKVFLDRPGRLLSRDQLLDLTQGKDRGPFDRSIDVLMSRLRKKLDVGTPTPIFKTVRNGGYQMTVQVRTLPVQR